MYKEFRIYVDGEETNRIYGADSASEAAEQYKADCINEYIDNFGEEPDMEELENRDIEANAILFG